MSWWKKRLEVTSGSETISALAKRESQSALVRAQMLRPQVDELSLSLGSANDLNHFSLRLALAYGLQGENK